MIPAEGLTPISTGRKTLDDDFDGDGIANTAELEQGTFTNRADSDGDGVDDIAELTASGRTLRTPTVTEKTSSCCLCPGTNNIT